MDKKQEESFRNHAWTLAIVAWLVGVALLYSIHWMIGDLTSRDLRWWLDALLYVVGFFYLFALGALHDIFFARLCSKAEKAD